MAQGKLRFGYLVISLMALGLVAFGCSMSLAKESPVGMTLLFQSAGPAVLVKRFDPDGMRGPVPGSVGGMYPRGGAQMAFMPGDSRQGLPKFVDVEWAVPTNEFRAWSAEFSKKSRAERYTAQGQQEYQKAWSRVPVYIQRVDLTSIITPELVEQVRANRQNTQLKLVITFNNENVTIQAMAYKWR